MKKEDHKEDNEELTKATVSRRVNKILNRIAIEEDKFVYQIIEDMVEKQYPEFFRGKKVNI